MAGRLVVDGKTFTEDSRTERVELCQLSKTQQGLFEAGAHIDSNEETNTEKLVFLVASGRSCSSSFDIDTSHCPPFTYGFSLEL